MKIPLWVAVVACVLILVGAYVFTPNLRSAFKVLELNGNPAVEGVNVVFAGEVSQVGAEGFMLANGGDSLEVKTSEQTKFSKSGKLEDIVNATPYTSLSITDGNKVRIDAYISGGKVWAKRVTFVGE